MSLDVLRAEETIRVYDWKDVRRSLRGMQTNLRTHCREELMGVAEEILQDAYGYIEERLERRTGLMERALQLVASMLGGTALQLMFYGAHYMVYQEYGFTHVPDGNWVEGKHFLRDAYDDHEDDTVDAVHRAVMRSLKESL
jgi:hypothetical protein